jgi:anti-sigma-K factor RskA
MKTYWHQHPETLDRIAAEYALGTLAAPARRRLDVLRRQRRDVAQAVWGWHERLGGVLAAQPPLPLRPSSWDQLEMQLFAQMFRTAPAKAPWWSRWLAPVPAGALAMGLLLGSVLGPMWEGSHSGPQLPESYVGVLANANGKPGLIVSSLRKGTTVDLKQLSPVDVPVGKVLFLWTIDKAGVVHPVSAVPVGKFVSASLPQPAEDIFFPAVELAVSVETAGVAPQKPSGPFVYRGLCGKLWKLPSD